MKLVFSERSLEYEAPGHPESPERVRVAFECVRDKFEVVSPEPAGEKDLLLVHTPEFVEKVKGENFKELDSPAHENIFYYATLAVGAAIKAQEIKGFSLMRPPGHHAGRDYLGGFCYFNNLAVAVKKSGLKTLIVDFDGHHGDGTEDIFLGDDQVEYISLHRTGIYPGSGLDSYLNVYNYPLGAYCGDENYFKKLTEALGLVADKNFEQIAVSAGFDGHVNDPLASLGLSTSAFEEIGRMLAQFNLPTFAVLEGGYIGEELAVNILAFIEGLESGNK